MYKITTKVELYSQENYTPEHYFENKELMTEWDLKDELKEGIPLTSEWEKEARTVRKDSSAKRPITKDSEGNFFRNLLVSKIPFKIMSRLLGIHRASYRGLL